MQRVRLVHSRAAEASVVEALLREAGCQVEYDPRVDSSLLRQWRADPPAVFVIDLSRLPSQGREIAIALRQSPKTRHVPIIFCNGLPEKVDLIRSVLPDAVFCANKGLVKAVLRAKPLPAPAKPADMMNRYGSRTTAQKLGIKEGSTVTAIDAPRNLEAALGGLPENVEFVEQGGSVTLCFVQLAGELPAEMSRLRSLAAKTKLWILWRKKTAPQHDGISEQLVRETGIDLGLVDYKICSVDDTWSAMLFAKRR